MKVVQSAQMGHDCVDSDSKFSDNGSSRLSCFSFYAAVSNVAPNYGRKGNNLLKKSLIIENPEEIDGSKPGLLPPATLVTGLKPDTVTWKTRGAPHRQSWLFAALTPSLQWSARTPIRVLSPLMAAAGSVAAAVPSDRAVFCSARKHLRAARDGRRFRDPKCPPSIVIDVLFCFFLLPFRS